MPWCVVHTVVSGAVQWWCGAVPWCMVHTLVSGAVQWWFGTCSGGVVQDSGAGQCMCT